MLIVLLIAANPQLGEASRLLEAFESERALVVLTEVKKTGPHRYADHVRLYELIGIAHAYLDQKAEALMAFEMLLDLDPAHVISYTLSPKATFLFEQARENHGKRPRPGIAISWPPDLRVSDPIPVVVEVLADPRGNLKKASLFHRPKGSKAYTEMILDLPVPLQFHKVRLPPPAPEATRPVVLELYLLAQDAKGNEVLMVGSADRPRHIPLAYKEPVAWYKRWWVWTLVGGVAAAATGIAVWQLSQEPPDRIQTVFEWQR